MQRGLWESNLTHCCPPRNATAPSTAPPALAQGGKGRPHSLADLPRSASPVGPPSSATPLSPCSSSWVFSQMTALHQATPALQSSLSVHTGRHRTREPKLPPRQQQARTVGLSDSWVTSPKGPRLSPPAPRTALAPCRPTGPSSLSCPGRAPQLCSPHAASHPQPGSGHPAGLEAECAVHTRLPPPRPISGDSTTPVTLPV